MKAAKIYIQKNGEITERTTACKDAKVYGFSVTLVNIITGEKIDCEDNIFATEREAMKESTKTHNSYSIARKVRLSRHVSYDDIAAVSVAQALNDALKVMKDIRMDAMKAAEKELRLTRQRGGIA